jgi:hypothetical protein
MQKAWDAIFCFYPILWMLLQQNKTSIHLTIPKITSGAMVISVTAQRPAPMYMKCQNGTSNSHVFLSSNSVIPD